ncbi:uncharacterized protein CIMG_00296 [Coccidioides immitis RS]|uniref:Uncharacterized protein n=1 Tax=Coccidioides immitis (strain RS) TaxID=246410 RepID=A0A0E1RZ76_COCIM|nr:uncharacterized protein CIMG_00296 [Coccidioides immitis RS]EAS34942.2 hypothetical protein CIMG_00296 [Coccidioides immitis RS]
MGDGGELLIIIGTERRETERESVCVGKKESVWWKGGCEQEVEVEEREKSIRRKSSDNTAFWWLIDGSLALHTEGRVTGFCIGSTADPEAILGMEAGAGGESEALAPFWRHPPANRRCVWSGSPASAVFLRTAGIGWWVPDENGQG